MRNVAKRIVALLLAVVFVLGMCGMASAERAEVRTYTAKGECIISDSESVQQGQEWAVQNALQNICEQAAVFIRSRNSAVGDDEAESIAFHLVKVKSKEFEIPETIIYGNETCYCIVVTVTAEVNMADVDEFFAQH